MAENPQKRRMSSFGSDEPTIPSLTRSVEYLKRQHVAITKEHSVIQSRYLKNKAVAEKEIRALKKERFDIGEKLQRTEDKFTVLTLEAGHMKEELKRLCGVEKRVQELEEALAVNPDANLRLSLKRLIVRYHPDKHSATVPLDNETVTRDLVELLEA